jgi:hypothetical protein
MSVAPAVVAAAPLAPATGGLSLLLPLLIYFGPALFSKLFGGEDQQAKLRRQILSLMSPDQIAKLTEQFYRQNISSPAYSQAQGTIATGANQTSNEVAASLAARGIGTTGTGAVLSGLTPSLVGSQLAGIRTAAHTAAGNMAQQNIASQIEALKGTVSGPSQSQQLFGAGLTAFEPYLQAYMRTKFPSLFTPRAAR